MRKTFLLIIALAGVVMVTGVIVFHYGHDLSWLDSVYFVVTTMMTVGYGDINLKDATPAVKVFGILLMLASGALLAGVFGIITDYLLKARLEQLLGFGRYRMRDHIVLCGLGHVGIRILEQLRKFGEEVIVIEKSEDGRFLDEAREMDIPVIIGDMRRPATLERANIKEARSLIAAGDDDLSNLEAALNAREAKPGIRVVLRIFDHNLAGKIGTGFGIKTTFSTSALAAPAFAMAAVDPAVVGSFYIDEDLMLILNIVVAAGSKLDGMSVDALTKMGGLAVLCHMCSRTGSRQVHPPDALMLAAGDKLVVTAASAVAGRIKEMNVPVSQ
jgi:Trk K+ transport system NAD-binding subunit